MSSVADLPLIRDPVREGVEPFNLRWIMGYAGGVGNDRHFSADPFEAVPNHRRNRHETIVVWPQEKLLNFAFRWAERSLVVQDELDPPWGTA